LYFKGEGYLAQESWALKLDKKKSGGAAVSRDGQMFFRSKKSLFDFAPEGYLTPSGWAPKLDK
jgi:hypothetical protein